MGGTESERSAFNGDREGKTKIIEGKPEESGVPGNKIGSVFQKDPYGHCIMDGQSQRDGSGVPVFFFSVFSKH